MKEILKRVIVVVLAVLMIFSLLFATASSVFAQDVQLITTLLTDDGFEYQINENSVTITKYTGEAGEISIPSIIEGLPVTAIGERAFEDKTTVTEITVPDSVVSVGANAFEGCSSLVVVNLGALVKEVNADTFFGCTNLTAVFVSENNQNLTNENGVLFNSNKTKLVFYPIGNSRESYTIPDSVKTICQGAFSGCNKLKTLVFPKTLETIEERAFLGCENIEELLLPSSLNIIGSYAFSSLKSLKAIEIPRGVTQISEATFSECGSLVSVKLPSTIKKIDANAFAFCAKLEELVFFEGLLQISEDVFLKCTALKSVTFPKSLKSVPQNALLSCDALTEIKYAGTEAEWQSLNCDFGNAMVVYNYIYEQDFSENNTPPSQNEDETNTSKPTKPDQNTQNTSSGAQQNQNTQSDTSSKEQTSSGDKNESDSQNISSSAFVPSGEAISFFESQKVTLSGDKNALPQNTEVTLEQMHEGLDFVRVKAAVKDYVTKFEVYKLGLSLENSQIMPRDALTIKFKIPEGYDTKKLQLLFVSDRGGASELDCTVSKKSGTISAKITQGGTYVLAEMTHVTQGMSVGSVTLCIAVILLIAALIVYFIKKSKQKSEK